MKRTLLAFCCSLVLVAFAGSAFADDPWPPPEKKCPADDEKTCKDKGGKFDPWKKTCTIKFITKEKCKNGFKAVVKHKIIFTEDYGKCKREESKKIIACYNKNDKPVDENACKNKCFKKDDDKDDDKGRDY